MSLSEDGVSALTPPVVCAPLGLVKPMTISATMTRPIANRVNVALEMRCCERGMAGLNVFWLRGAHR